MQSDDERFSEESKKFLLEAKKGKPRKFVIIKDGVQIDRLVVFKTGTFDKAIRAARQGGASGEAYYGMLQGDGTDIRFELSTADGFTTPPGTDARLKEFLREAGGLKFEPSYVIVDKPTAVEQGDDSETEASEETQAAGDAAADGGSSVVEENAEDKFVRFLKSILPHVKRALATKTSLSDELQQSVREAQDFGRRREFDPGLEALRKVGALTKRALSEADAARTVTTTSESATPSGSAKPKRRDEWDTRLKEVRPKFSAAVGGSAPNANKLQKVMGYALDEARQQRFVKALVALDRLERLLKESAAAMA